MQTFAFSLAESSRWMWAGVHKLGDEIMRYMRHVLLASASACLFMGSSASAQDADAEATEEGFDNAIVVTGVISSAGQNKIDTSVSVSSISPQAIADANPTNLAEVFRQLPGIRSESSSGGGNSNINVRGIPISTGGAKFLSMQEDGLPILLFGDHLFAPAEVEFIPDRHEYRSMSRAL